MLTRGFTILVLLLSICNLVTGKVYHSIKQKVCQQILTTEGTDDSSSNGGNSTDSGGTGTSSADDSEATTVVQSGSITVRALFPIAISSEKEMWSTATVIENALPLSDSTLRISRVTRGTTHNVESAPDGKKGMEAFFRKGSVEPGDTPYGGFSFYFYGPASVDLKQAKEILFSYSVYFDSGFDWNKGGKMPGVYGGESDSGSVSCSGGRHSDSCFSLRLMWRTGGAGELYTYLPPSAAANKKVCSNCPYGASVGRGKFTWQSGKWNTVAERVRLNDVGQSNGEVEVFYGGKSVISLTGIVMRMNSAGVFRGIQAQTFFGGHTSDWGSPKDQRAYFADWSAAIIS